MSRQGVWKEMEQKRILITGATSLIGRRLTAALERQNWQVTAVVRSRRSTEGFSEKTKTLFLDLKDYSRLGELAGPCDCFVHLAWNGTRGAARMDVALQRTNLEYSLQGVHSMLETGCGRIVTAGSQAEYGPHAEQITEESLCVPNTEYGKAKLEFYQKTAALCGEFGAVCIEPRFFSLYGPGDYDGSMVISTLRKMLAGAACKLTQGIQMWDFLYIDDAVHALRTLCEADCADGVYNFGSGDVRQLRAYIEEMAQITGTKSSLLFGAVPYPETGMVSLWPDVSRLKRELGWTPRVTFAEGIRSILDVMDREESL